MPHDVIRAFEEGGGLDRSRGAEPRIGGHVRIPRSRFAPPRVGGGRGGDARDRHTHVQRRTGRTAECVHAEEILRGVTVDPIP